MESIGERIRAKRKLLGFTMKQLHDSTGLSTGNISDIENGKYSPSVMSLVPLAKALKCSIDWLLTGEEYLTNAQENADDSTNTQITECSQLELKTNEELLLSEIKLSKKETDLIAMFRELDERDKEDAYDNVYHKYKRASKKEVSLYSTYGSENAKELIPDIPKASNGNH